MSFPYCLRGQLIYIYCIYNIFICCRLLIHNFIPYNLHINKRHIMIECKNAGLWAKCYRSSKKVRCWWNENHHFLSKCAKKPTPSVYVVSTAAHLTGIRDLQFPINILPPERTVESANGYYRNRTNLHIIYPLIITPVTVSYILFSLLVIIST